MATWDRVMKTGWWRMMIGRYGAFLRRADGRPENRPQRNILGTIALGHMVVDQESDEVSRTRYLVVLSRQLAYNVAHKAMA